ncbi:LysR family transcriptional regulator [Bradyrhizobium sp.]|uniref:LysR family transcriptional regulator n=1 Tax=Bradyrhizobium sp. TaxID=376 RepID=UPI002DDD0AF4|nr:LysR family transcriptional regulator [Bradyrhizobium sp.]HEV2160566.1 LysR family transcriptional regulator [Bradyrhizobium sp.]
MNEANWDLLRLFFAVANTGSVNAAARQLNMSQPTLSRRLKELERYVGAPLFFRVPSGVLLTQEGEDLKRAAASVVGSFSSFHQDWRLRVGPRTDVVKISATEGMTKHWLLPRVHRLYELHPHIRLHINSTIEQQDLTNSDLDFVIRMGHPGDNELIGRKITTVGFSIYASEAYLSRRGQPKSAGELKGHDVIGTSGDFSGFRGERVGRMPLLTIFLKAAEASRTLRLMPLGNHYFAAREGLGLAFLATPFAMAEGLVPVLPEESMAMDVWLLRRRESDLRKLTRQVGRFLEKEFAASKAWFASGETVGKQPTCKQ